MFMQNIRSRGFTLIELLVVIAIIGVLSAVVLASLNTARNKGNDAAIKANLDSARAQAEIFYDSGITYDGVCDDTAGIVNMVNGATSAGGTVTCNDSPTAYAISSTLVSTPSVHWCVDSSGQAGTSSTGLGTDVICP
jgi:prepilin-type N-terminal cleavage/methylation domain-containing protein